MLNSSLNYTLLIILFQIIYVLVRLKEGRDKSGNFVLCCVLLTHLVSQQVEKILQQSDYQTATAYNNIFLFLSGLQATETIFSLSSGWFWNALFSWSYSSVKLCQDISLMLKPSYNFNTMNNA